MLAIIPARGGSKGLLKKNIKDLNGKPLIAYTIEAALKSQKINRVIVNTDDVKIAEISKKYGAEIPFIRPEELATDTAKSIDVYQHAINWLEKNEKVTIDHIVILQPTSPLRTSIHIDEAIQLFEEKKADSVISYCKENHPIFWHKFISKDKKFEEIFEGDFLKNRQEIKETYYPNGAIYVFKKDLLFKNKYYTEKSYAYIMESKYSVDIDTIEDFEYARYILRKENE